MYNTELSEKQTKNILSTTAKKGHLKSFVSEELNIWYFGRVTKVVIRFVLGFLRLILVLALLSFGNDRISGATELWL